MVVVSEEFIALAILRLVEMEKAVVEGAGATGIAAILAGLLPELEGKKYVYDQICRAKSRVKSRIRKSGPRSISIETI